MDNERSQQWREDIKHHWNAGLALDRAGKSDAAIAELRKAVALNPKIAELHNDLGLILDTKGERAAAIAELREAVRLASRKPKPHFALGTCLYKYKEGDGYEALTEIQEAIRLDPAYIEAYISLGNVCLYMNKDPKMAVAAYSEAIRLNPNHARAYLNLGLAFWKQGNLDASLESYLKVGQIAPGTRGLKKAIISIQLQRGQFFLALKELLLN